MLKKTLRANYRHKLARPLTLADGTTLVTLRDAANVLLDAANTRSGGLVTRSGRCGQRRKPESGPTSPRQPTLIERALRDRLVGSGK